MRNFTNRWIARTWRIPPRDFWPTLIQFLGYAFVQALHAVRRSDRSINRNVDSHLNFKRAHYLEKAMLCQYERTDELDSSFALLESYLETPQGIEDDCYLYLRKILEEYRAYPDGFRCYMRDVPAKPRAESEAAILRRTVVQRRSGRHFKPDQVDDELIERIVEAGSYAPTSCNAQPLTFISLTERANIDRIFGSARGADAWKSSIPAGIVVLTDRRHYKPFEQHAVMFQDIAAATQNMLLMCEALGLAACWVSLISDSHIMNQHKIYETLGLPSHYLIGAAIAIGHPGSTVCHVPRRPVDRIWHRNSFRSQDA